MTIVYIAVGFVGLLFAGLFVFSVCRAAAVGDAELRERNERERLGKDA